MSTKHIYPQVILIELNALSSLIAYMLNEASHSNLLQPDSANRIAYTMIQYNLDMRCTWLMQVNSYMNVVERENMVMHLDLPEAFKYYLANNCNDAFMIIEDTISDILDAYVDKRTWYMWSMELYQGMSLKLINDGDYRIMQWAAQQEVAKTEFAKRHSPDHLRSVQ